MGWPRTIPDNLGRCNLPGPASPLGNRNLPPDHADRSLRQHEPRLASRKQRLAPGGPVRLGPSALDLRMPLILRRAKRDDVHVAVKIALPANRIA